MPFNLKQNLIGILTLALTVLAAAAGTIMSYGALTAKVDAVDQRLSRIERLLDNRTVAQP